MSELTDEQREIVDLPPADRALVIAGPGTGKTHTLIARCLHLGEETVTETLVLSFTRAVIAEIKQRAGKAGGARTVASTIDGYAARLLLSTGKELAGDFDRTIVRASALLSDEPQLVRHAGHVLVDEVQDLVEPRLTFVMRLLGQAQSGFTAFGDPAQSIFGFQADPGGANGVDQLRATAGVRELRLTHTHRKRVGEILTARRPVSGTELIARARPLTSVAQLKLLMGARDAALLTRTNGEALMIASLLAESGIQAQVRQGASTRAAPGWIARLAAAAPRSRLTRRSTVPLLEAIPGAPSPAEAWGLLRRVAAVDGDVSLSRLRQAVLRPAAHDDFGLTDRGSISTIHRAKGLEWDQVIVLDPIPTETMTDEEDRVLFVAATRARRDLWRLHRPDFGGRLGMGANGRWELRSWPGRPLALEIRLGDVACDEPFGQPTIDAHEVQSAIFGLTPGEPARLRNAGDVYIIEVRGNAVATTTATFFDDVRRRWSRPPQTLLGARVLRTRSLAGDSATTERHGLSDTGLWVGVELVGLVRPSDEWKDDDV